LNWPKILITGAGGFIGGWITEELYRFGAANIRASTGRRASRARIAQLPIEIVDCDIMDPKSLDAAMAGIEVVIHCARSRTDERTTVEGTQLVLKRAAANGVKKLVHMSSVAVYGNALGVVTEETRPVAPVSSFGESKLAAEEACRAASGANLTVAVVRPSLVYGPFGDEWTTRYIKQILSGHLKNYGPAGEGNANLIYVKDLASFAAHLVTENIPEYSVYIANGQEIPTFNQYFSRLSRALGRGPLQDHSSGSPGLRVALRRPIRIVGKYMLKNHQQLLLKVANSSSLINDLMKRSEANLRLGPNDDEIRFGTNVTFSTLRAKALGFESKTSLEDGIAASVEWARDVGLVK
jgi:nucleoside-diphosphate-sugar epimerase